MSVEPRFVTTGKLWRVQDKGGWFFVTIDKKTAHAIRFFSEGRTVGLGYVKVSAKIGKTSWETTLFPTKEKHYLLAIKASVRKAEALSEGDRVRVTLELL